METATQPTPIEIECQFCEFKGNAAEGARHRQETQHLIRIVGERDAPAPQETPAQRPKFDKSGLKEACERGLALGRARQEFDLQLLLDMLLEIERYESRDPAFQKLVKAAEVLIAADNCNYDRDVMRHAGLFEQLREALRLAREGEE